MSGGDTTRIAELNDRFRAAFGSPSISGGVPGSIVITSGVGDLEPIIQAKVFASIAVFDAFTEDNDPYGEHDFGAVDIDGAGKIFWKIDYYADDQLIYGSEAPDDLEKSYRVMTIMLANDY